MPPKRKNTLTTSAPADLKPKRSKPTFRPVRTTIATGSENMAASQTTSSKAQVTTLRTNASGRRGYHTREQSTISSTSSSSHTFGTPDISNTLPTTNPIVSEDDTNSVPSTKSKAKQKNTTAVCNLF